MTFLKKSPLLLKGYHWNSAKNHFIFWILFSFYELSVILVVNPQNLFLIDSLFAMAINIATVYSVAHFAFPSLSSKRINYWKTVLVIILIVSAYIMLKYGWAKFCLEINVPTSINLQSLEYFVATSVWRCMYFVLIGTAYWFVTKLLFNERALRINEEHKQSLEKEVLASKLSFLKAQINPHFLFNVLSFIYSHSLKASPKVAEAVLTLSEIMRYSLQESDAEGKTSLSNELEHISKIIKISQMRFEGKLCVDYAQTGNTASFRIIPLVLVTFVENALKYGELKDKDNPIIIRADVFKNQLTFRVYNKKSKYAIRRDSHGIGVSNIKERLEDAYANNYSLQINQDTSNHEVILKIAL